MIEVDIGGVLFLGGLKESPHGLFVEDGGFRGWESGTGGRRESVARPAAHGDFDMPLFRESRVVTLNGYALGRSAFDLGHLRDQVVGLGADGSAVTLTVKQHGYLRRSLARIVSVDFVDSGRATSRGRFTVELVCSDPRKFGDLREFSGSSVQVHHYGNFPASPVVEVVGPRTAPYTITGPGGRQFVVNQSLSAGQTHRIDFRSGRLYRNGSLQIGQTGRSDTWAVPAGQRITMGISSGSMTVKLADTYM